MTEPPERPFTWHLTDAESPAELLEEIAADLRTHSGEVDYAVLVGCGPLESMFHQGYDAALWPRIEELARSDAMFLEALASVWASDSATAERRRLLIEELRGDT